MRSSSIVESVEISTMWKIAQYDFDLAATVSAPGMHSSSCVLSLNIGHVLEMC